MKSIPAVTFKVSVHNTPTHPEGKTTTQHNTNPARLTPPPPLLWLPSECADGEREVAPWWRDDVALLPGQPQQQVLVVQAPAVDPGALQPGGNVLLLAQTHTQGRGGGGYRQGDELIGCHLGLFASWQEFNG